MPLLCSACANLAGSRSRTVAIEYRWTEGRDDDRLPEIAADLAQHHVDIVVTGGTAAVNAAKQAMPATPIVFALAGDPVGTGIVASLARPGGNVTGMSNQLPDTDGKRLELLREVVPDLRGVAIMANVGLADTLLEMGDVQRMAKTLGLDVVMLEIRRAEDIAAAFVALQDRAQALYICADPLVSSNRTRINTLAQAARLPTMWGFRDYVEAGGLLSYGPNVSEMFRRTADLVDKILRGAKPADIPVEQPTKFDLVVNLTTAKALGLTIPVSFLLRADEVIE